MGKVLVVADREGLGSAIPRGLELAARLGLAVDVCAFVHAPLAQLKLDSAGRAAVKRKLQDKRREQLETYIARHSSGGQKVRVQVQWQKDVGLWVCNRCARGDIEFVVKTGGHVEGAVHSSTDWTLLRECPAAVLIVADTKWRNTAPVLAALDLATGSAAKKRLNDAILNRAVSLASAMGESLHVICAVEVPTLLRDLDLVEPASYVAEARTAMQSEIAALAKRHGLAEKAFKVKRGPAEKVIASEAAARRAQLVVLGCVGRKGLRARLLGNTAERVLQHLKTDVLALKP